MENYIIAGILIFIVGAVIFYLVREKKKGVKCIGCPHAKQCKHKSSDKCGGECMDHIDNQETKNS